MDDARGGEGGGREVLFLHRQKYIHVRSQGGIIYTESRATSIVMALYCANPRLVVANKQVVDRDRQEGCSLADSSPLPQPAIA